MPRRYCVAETVMTFYKKKLKEEIRGGNDDVSVHTSNFF